MKCNWKRIGWSNHPDVTREEIEQPVFSKYMVMKHSFSLIVGALCLPLLTAQGAASTNNVPVRLELNPQAGVHRMYELPDSTPGRILPVTIELSVASQDGKPRQVEIHWGARDIFHQPIAWNEQRRIALPADAQGVRERFEFPAVQGFFQVFAACDVDGIQMEASTGIGIVPPHRTGVRPDSFFASNTSNIRRGQDLRFLQMLGMKVQRTHLNPIRASIPDRAEGPLELNLEEMDRAFADCKRHDTWIMPIVGYHFGERMRSELARRTGMHGPPRDVGEFVNTWETIVRRYPEIRTYEFWNEPWIYGWTWAAEPEVYRQFQKAWCEMARKSNPGVRLIAGNSSMFVEDHIEPYPDCWRGLLDGTSHHPYSGVHDPTFRNSGQGRALDQGAVVTRRMQLPYYYMTEAGSASGDEIDAYKLVQYFVRSALAGAFQGNAQWGFGYHPGNTRANTTFAVMTHWLEDRPIVADIWPHHELLWGAIFAHPSQVTDAVKRLPRANELSSRWNVPVPPDREADDLKVAVVWCHTGPDAGNIDPKGRLLIPQPGDIRAYDLVGREIPQTDGAFTVPFGERVVWLTTRKLDVVTFRDRIAHAQLHRLTPLNAYALSLIHAPQQAQTLNVRVENQLNRAVAGTLTMTRHADGKRSHAPFTIPGGQLAEVPLEWPANELPPQSRYELTLEFETDAGSVSYRQSVASARFYRRPNISVDGKLDDWTGVLPIYLDSARQDGRLDPTLALLNPGKVQTARGDGGRVQIRLYTAFDDNNVYVAAAVNEPQLTCRAGQPVIRRGPDGVVELPYRMGEPEGLEHISLCGDALFFAFGFRDRVPGWGRQMDDPWAWKGHFYDTDYQYVMHPSTTGPKLIRQWGADTSRRTAYQTTAVPGVGPVEGAVVRIERDENTQLTIYEAAIPRTELELFNPQAERLRFSFLLKCNEVGWPLQWASAAGVFDYWLGSGSFSPSWVSVLPCQTVFGIEK